MGMANFLMHRLCAIRTSSVASPTVGLRLLESPYFLRSSLRCYNEDAGLDFSEEVDGGSRTTSREGFEVYKDDGAINKSSSADSSHGLVGYQNGNSYEAEVDVCVERGDPSKGNPSKCSDWDKLLSNIQGTMLPKREKTSFPDNDAKCQDLETDFEVDKKSVYEKVKELLNQQRPEGMRKQQKLHRTSRWNMEFLSSKGEMPEELKELLNQECQEEMCEQQKLNHKARQDMEWFFSKYMHEEKKLNHKDIVKRCQEEMHEQQKRNRKARQDMALLFLKDMHEEKKLNHNIREDKNHKICEDMELTSKEVRGDAMKCVPMRFSSIWDATTLEDMERSLTDSVYEPYSNRVKQSQTMPKSESCSYVKHKSHQKNEDSTAFDDVSKSIDAPPALGEAAHGVRSSDGRVAQQKYMVCIPHLHPKRFTGLIRALMATFRDIVGFYKKAEHGSVWLNVYVEFKTEEAMKNALAVGKVQLGDKMCHIIKGDYSIFTSVVRITRLSNDISKRELKAICESYGKVDAIKKHATGAIDVFYDLEERGNMENILKRLNEFRFNGSTWMAAAAPALHPSTPKEMLKSPEGRAWHGDHSLMILFKMETGLDAVSVMFEDLKELLMGDHPST